MLFEDEAFLAIDKPAGVAVHGSSGVSFGVIEQLRGAAGRQVFWNWCIAWTGNQWHLLVAKKARALKTCKTSSANAKPARPTWRWWRCVGKPKLKVLDAAAEVPCCPTVSAA